MRRRPRCRARSSALRRYSWSGNVRELQNVIERAVVLCPGPVLSVGPDTLPLSTPSPGALPPTTAAHAPGGPSGLASLLEQVEREQIVAALSESGGVIDGPRGAALRLKVHPKTLRSRMEKLGIKRRAPEGS
jgi:formate hydrogenlyase transcriptional activator